MTDRNEVANHEKLTKEAALAITATRPHPGGRSRIIFEDAEDFARAALAVFEKAHTPTDDERQAQRIAELDARQAAMQQDRIDWFPDYETEPTVAHDSFVRGWDSAVRAGFRRSEVPEPSAEGYPDAEGLAALRSNASEPQGEPSGIPFYDQKMRELAEVRAQGEPSDAGRVCGPCSRGQHAPCDRTNEFWGDCTCSCNATERSGQLSAARDALARYDHSVSLGYVPTGHESNLASALRAAWEVR